MSKLKKGVHYDDGKPPLQLLPAEYLQAAARAFAYGAQKYSARNWELGGIGYDRLFGSLMRHLWSYHSGETVDPESSLSHLDHACASLAMLVATVDREGHADSDGPRFDRVLPGPHTEENSVDLRCEDCRRNNRSCPR